MKKLLSLTLVFALLFSVVGVANADTPFVSATMDLSEKFSPFFATSNYDLAVAGMTQIDLLTLDRVGAIIDNGIEGETRPYNGKEYEYKGAANTSVKYDEATDKTIYTAKLKEGIQFSDGVELTADDIIFSYYVILDPSYDGSNTLRSYDIVGLNDYLTQTTSAVYEKYAAIVKDIAEKGSEYKATKDDAFTQEQVDDYWSKINDAWKATTEAIVDEVNNKYADQAAQSLNLEKIEENQRVAAAANAWGFSEFTEGKLIFPTTKQEFDFAAGTFPTLENLVEEAKAKYANDLATYSSKEHPKNEDLKAKVDAEFISFWGPKDEEMKGQGVPNVAGIKKLDKYTVEVTVNGFSAPAVYQIFGLAVAPMHYYGDPAQYDYDNNKFGHPYGDLSVVRSKTNFPMGAGPYKFVKYENRVVYFEANEYYYKGAPKIKNVQFKETQESEKIPGILSGSIDTADIGGKKSTLEQIANENSNKELSGDKLTSFLVDNRGYGYIGLNSETINVGGKENKGSEQSKALRKAIATAIAFYRNIAVDTYYGDAASVIEYPISNTSWAAPQKTDPDYVRAFSVDPEGNAIYSDDNTFEQNEEAALKAVRAWLTAAGYTLDENGKATSAPEGAKLSYEIIIPAGGSGDHPAYAIATSAGNLLAKAGIELKINDPADANVLWNSLDAGTQELWAAAWGSTIDPDMYQIYHSSNIKGLPGATGSNHYRLADPELDQLIMDARKSADQGYRKAVYKNALERIADWAVEIPTYQRKNGDIFSTERVNIETIPTDVTTFYSWGGNIENVELK